MIARRARHTFWWREKLEQILQKHQDLWSELLESGKRRRIIDFNLTPGRIQARVQDDTGKMFRCELLFELLDAGTWEKALLMLANQSLTTGAFLAGVLPEEVDAVFSSLNVELSPPYESFRHRCECKKDWCGHQIALWDRFRERVDEDPFTLFYLRGKTRDEMVASLRQIRAQRQRHAPQGETPEPITSGAFYSAADFWKRDPLLLSLSYDIRADELPAALLKRMESVPLDNVDLDPDRALEEAYVQVAKRAQAFGLGMIRNSHER